MDYQAFENYPIQILGIDESYIGELTAIENNVISEIAYTGDVLDIVPVLPYFVFCAFIESRLSAVNGQVGEQKQIAEFSLPSFNALIKAWNVGASSLDAICTIKEQTANLEYTSPISLC